MSQNHVNPEIAVLGEVMIEMAPQGNGCYQMGVAGDTFNTAAALSRLGIQVQYLTMLGQDLHSERILSAMTELDIGQQWILRDKNRHPGLYIIDNTADGERYFSYWRDQSAARALFSSAQRLEQALQPLQCVAAIYLSGITLALCSNESRTCLFEFLKNYPGRIYYDCNYRPALWPDRQSACQVNQAMVALADVYLPGLDDEMNLSGSDNVTVIKQLAGKAGLEVAMTAGAGAITVMAEGKTEYWQPPGVAQVVDTTGAGDSFNGAYIAARIRGCDMLPAAQFASAVASCVIGERGAIMAQEKWLPLKEQLFSTPGAVAP